MSTTIVRCEINGEPREALVEASATVLELLREQLGLTGTKEGCSNGNCGACTVLVEGEPVCACLMLAPEADGMRLTTIEGIADGATMHPVQTAIIQHGGTQCGFCTPGIVVSAVALLAHNPAPDEAQIRHAIAGNICRCTGYDKIVTAIAEAARTLQSEGKA